MNGKCMTRAHACVSFAVTSIPMNKGRPTIELSNSTSEMFMIVSRIHHPTKKPKNPEPAHIHPQSSSLSQHPQPTARTKPSSALTPDPEHTPSTACTAHSKKARPLTELSAPNGTAKSSTAGCRTTTTWPPARDCGAPFTTSKRTAGTHVAL